MAPSQNFDSADQALLRRSAFFDEHYYLSRYTDVAEAGVDAVTHYLECGALEGRDPGPDFSTQGYLALYPDVKADAANPLVHFLRHGLAEGREPGTLLLTQTVLSLSLAAAPAADSSAQDYELVRSSLLFDPEYYVSRYPDVAAAGINPIDHYLSCGAAEGRDPSESFSSTGYLKRHSDVASNNLNPLLHYLKHGAREGRLISRAPPLVPSLRELCLERWRHLSPIPSYSTPVARPRLNVVTDSVAATSLFGGVGTALLLATQLANHVGALLRLITRSEEADARALGLVLSANGIQLEGPFEVIHMPSVTDTRLELTSSDIFLTTSWWTTQALLRTVSTDRVVYLLQEDERMFYPFGDDRVQCEETMATPGLTTVINTELLARHLTEGPHAVPGLAARARSFEPAFRTSPAPTKARTDRRMKFFFYSRPNNLRNLFWRGADAICEAIETDVLSPALWDFYFVGKETPKFTLPRGASLQVLEGMTWSEYQSIVSIMDGALVLMDTPHPSYPPLDLAAAGVAVLTNSHGVKSDLSSYSANILVAEPTLQGLSTGLQRLVPLAADSELRRKNTASDHICRDWAAALSATVVELADKFSQQKSR